tara:strand:- start:985 stop:1614 length:630 start_codon:yes stop_codon:yes gene_type:complete
MVEVEIDIEAEIESAVAEAMDEYGPDYDEIRHQIEGDILDQVEDHIDWSNAECNLDIGSLIDEHCDYQGYITDDDFGIKIQDLVESGCNVVDRVAVNLLNRAVCEQSDNDEFHLPSLGDWNELQAQVRALSQIIDTSSVRTSLADDIVNAYRNNEINSEAITGTIAELRNVRYQAIRYLCKSELIEWAFENNFGDLNGMKVADIHKVIL